MPAEFQIKIVDRHHIIPKLTANGAQLGFWQQAWRNALERATFYVLGQSQQASPVKTARLRSDLKSRVDPSPVPLWGQVGTNVKPYPKILEYGGRGGRARYRRGPRKGQLLKGWLSGVLKASEWRVRDIIKEAVQEIEQAWRR